VGVHVLGELNKELDKTHRSSKQSADLFKVEYAPTEDGGRLGEKEQGPDSPVSVVI
jgi:hypothetical protein